MRRTAVLFPVILGALGLSGPGLEAQSVVSVGGELVRWEEETTILVGIRAATGRPGEPGIDAGLQVIPELLGAGGLAMVGDLGLGFNVPVGERAMLIPHAGGTSTLFIGDGGGGAVGIGGGMALVLTGPEERGVRLDLTYRRFGEGVETFGLSMGIAWRRTEG